MKQNTQALKHLTDSSEHKHILFTYGTHQERLHVLADYFGEGLAKDELCIFVTPDAPKKALKEFASVGFDADKAYAQNNLRIFEMTDSYLPQGKFASNDMLLKVVNFIMDAQANGYKGVRTAGEMSWLYDHPQFLTAATHYEQQITALGRNNPDFTGLCMYPAPQSSSPDEILGKAFETHPSYISNGAMQTNPQYSTATAA